MTRIQKLDLKYSKYTNSLLQKYKKPITKM